MNLILTLVAITEHKMNTRNNNLSTILPQVRVELTRQGFFSAGGSLYNFLSLGLRQISNIFLFNPIQGGRGGSKKPPPTLPVFPL